MKRLTLLYLLICGWTSILLSQQTTSAVLQYVKEKDAIYSINKSTGYLNFIRFDNSPVMIALPEDVLGDFIEGYGFLFGITSPSLDFKFVKKVSDNYGFRHYYYRQFYRGIPVFGGDFRLHFNPSGHLQVANGVVFPDINCPVVPVITKEDALFLAKAELREKYGIDTPLELVDSIRLLVYRQGLVQGYHGKDFLTFSLALKDESGAIRSQVLVDAIKGHIIDEFSDVHEVISRELYNMNLSNLIWQAGDAFPGALNTYQQNEVVAAEHTYNLFKNAFGQLSYDGACATMKTIHANPGISCPNANWNGSTTNFCTNTASDDVVAHEWGHAYTQYTSNLIYGWQTGALNESYSDIWGETVDLLNAYEDAGEDLSLRSACGSSLRWMMGEDAGGFGGAIRDMWDPTCKGDPGKVSDGNYYCGTGDAGGVHTNSGVSNHAYALLVDGGTYNGQTITGLGFTKAAHVYWRSQAFYLTRTSDYSVQAAALEAACNDLLGINLEGLSTTGLPAGPSGEIITASDCVEVSEVNLAVEFTAAPPCGFVPMLDPATPSICGGTTSAQTIFSDDFESGIGTWTVSQHPVNATTWDSRDWSIQGSLPDGRSGHAIVAPDPVVGDCDTDLDNGMIRLETPVISIPATASTDLKLSFSHYASMESKWDGGNVKYSINGGAWNLIPSGRFVFNAYNDALNASNDNPMAGEVAFTGADGGSVTGSWGESQVDLAGLGLLPGDDIQLRWEMGTDGCNGWDAWYVDDVLLCSCETVLPVTLSNFNAFVKSKYIEVNWQTEAEINHLGFYLQRRDLGAHNFNNIAWIDKGSATHYYEYLDEEVLPGMTYFYRLAQMDEDGKLTYFEVVEVEMGGEQAPVIYPNPAQNEIFINYSGHQIAPFQVDLIRIDGMLLQTWSFLSANKPLRIGVQEIPRGVYLLSIKSAGNSWMEKIIID